jgi:hypothetical protein
MKLSVPHQSAEVHYTIEVIDAAGRVARRLPRRRNLILDQGLDGIAARTWAASFTHAAVGTGTTPTKRDSGAITFSRTGDTVTASAGFFVADDVGRLLKFDSGEEVRITAFTDANTVTTADSGSIAAAEGTIWYVNQTGLVAETKRSGTYSTDAGANGSSFAAGAWTHKRTFIFDAEVGSVVYREIGWSHTASAGANLFGRDLLPGVGVSLVAGQQLRVTVELSVSYSPSTSSVYTNVVTGWTQDGTHGVEGVRTGHVETVTAAGGTADTGGGVMEPATAGRIAISTDTTGIRATSTANLSLSGLLLAKAASLGSYVSGSFTRDKSATFGVTEANSTAIRSLQLTTQIHTGVLQDLIAYRVLLDAAEAKTSSQTLTLVFRLSWGRVLNNA